jgi:Ca2+-binding EF-hand superfamily protein
MDITNEKLVNKNTKIHSIEPFEIDQDIKSIELKSVEKTCLKRVYQNLIKLEQEMSSDEESMKKKYLKHIEIKANQKKMSVDVYKNRNSSILHTKNRKNTKDTLSSNSHSHSLNTREDSSNMNDMLNNQNELKISQKSLRKILRKLISPEKFPKEEIELMVWEVDDDMDGKITKYEFQKMFKRCINDTSELEPKRLFYLVLFLMYDKENKTFITEEDTLELLCSRYGQKNSDKVIEDMFMITVTDPDSNVTRKVIKDRIDFEEFLYRMKNLALKKRAYIKERVLNYCEYINEDKDDININNII